MKSGQLPAEYDEFIGKMMIALRTPLDASVALRLIHQVSRIPSVKIIETRGSLDQGFRITLLSEVAFSVPDAIESIPGIVNYQELPREETTVSDASRGVYLRGVEIYTQ